MKKFQDTLTGMIWEFDDEVDPFEFPSTPKTLSTAIEEKPAEHYVWVDGKWKEDLKVKRELQKQSILLEIAKLESSITSRRIREAIAGIDNGWLEAKEEEIKKLRESIK